MTFQTFLGTYNGQNNVGNTSENKGECVGLVAVWVDSLGLPHIWGHAMDLFVNADEKFFDKFLNIPDAIPQAGDIIVWNKKFNGTFGHTAICTGTADLNTLEVFELNNPLGSNCHLKTYKNYNYITGWLRPIVASSDKLIIDQLRAEILAKEKLYQDQVQHGINQEESINGLNKINEGLKKENEVLKSELQVDSDALQGLRDTVATLTIDKKALKDSIDDLNNKLTIMMAQRKDLAKWTTKELINEIISRLFKGGGK